MKIRTDFVTNSSSSSFVVELNLELADGTSVSVNGGLLDEEDNFGPSFTIKNSKGRTIKKGDSGIGSVYLEPNEMPKSVLHNFYFHVSAINLGKICSESSVKSLISAIAEPLDLSEHITDVEYNDDDEETIEIIDGFQNKFNTAVDDFNSALTKHITKVSDVKKASVSMQFSEYGETYAVPEKILLNKVFEKNETDEIINIISNTSENKILEELRKLTYLERFTDKSLENIVVIAKNCDFNDAVIIQTLQPDGKIDLTIKWDE